MHLFFGVRTEEDNFRAEEFRALEAKHPNFRLHLCLSGDNPTWTGNKGRVQQFIPSVIKDKEKTQIYICGAPEMVSEIKKIALETFLLPKSNVHAEGYI
jgi:NAD(P)H-flavin reductase